MKKHTGSRQPRRDPMQWSRNARFEDNFSAPRSETLDCSDHASLFGTGDVDPFAQMDMLRSSIRGSEQRLEMIRDISQRLQQNGSIRL